MLQPPLKINRNVRLLSHFPPPHALDPRLAALPSSWTPLHAAITRLRTARPQRSLPPRSAADAGSARRRPPVRARLLRGSPPRAALARALPPLFAPPLPRHSRLRHRFRR